VKNYRLPNEERSFQNLRLVQYVKFHILDYSLGSKRPPLNPKNKAYPNNHNLTIDHGQQDNLRGIEQQQIIPRRISSMSKLGSLNYHQMVANPQNNCSIPRNVNQGT
jgi:hypothetical protein